MYPSQIKRKSMTLDLCVFGKLTLYSLAANLMLTLPVPFLPLFNYSLKNIIYLERQVLQKARDKRSSICWFTPEMTEKIRAELS